MVAVNILLVPSPDVCSITRLGFEVKQNLGFVQI
jgi:hypothetical protein